MANREEFFGKMFPNTLTYMENSVLMFYQTLFSMFPEGCFRYNDLGDDTSEIAIEGRHTDNLKNVDQRPKIVVARGPVSYQGRGMGGGNFVGSANLSPLQRTFVDIQEGSVGVNCFSREDLESERIAQICWDSVKMFNQAILKMGGFLSIKASSVGQRGLIKQDSRPELFVTPVLISMQITRNWDLTRTDPIKLKQILFEIVTSP